MYCLDFTVVGVSLGFEIWAMIHHDEDDPLSEIVQLVIVGRLWRFVSIAYDLLSMQYEHDHETIESLRERISVLEYKLMQ